MGRIEANIELVLTLLPDSFECLIIQKYFSDPIPPFP